MSTKQRLLFITTGGTIASVRTQQGLKPVLTSEELLAHLPELNELCCPDTLALCSIDSTDLGPEHWLMMAKAVQENYALYDGFIICHGTDTLAYSAAALSYLIQNADKPVILTGAQQPISNEITDAKKNLRDSVICALDPGSRGAAYENAQARERTQILMDVANMEGGLVIGTGDLSELALGWATYNGDQMSMYGVNASVPKTLVRHLVKWAAATEQDAATRATLLDIIDTPVSPELLPADDNGKIAQKTEDLVGPYELHDFFLYNFLRAGYGPAKILLLAEQAFDGSYDRAAILRWLTVFVRRFFTQQFKRSAMPDGPKVGSVTLSPRGDWRMPSDASAAAWLRELDTL